MTIQDYIETVVHRPNKVKIWLQRNYIPRAYQNYDGEWVIPEDARDPYTLLKLNRRSKQSTIQNRLLIGLNNHLHISADICNLSQDIFENTMSNLIEDRLVRVYVKHGVNVYDITSDGIDKVNALLSGYIKNIIDVMKWMFNVK